MRCSVNRLLQLATKPRLQSMRLDTSCQVWPSASSKISRARRASSARSVRLWARRVSSLSSAFVNVIASLMDAIIVYKWLLRATRRRRNCPFAQLWCIAEWYVDTNGTGTHMSNKCGGLNGSTQHLFEVYSQESQKLKSFASVESIGTQPCLVLIEYSRTDRFSRGSIVGSTD